MSMISLIFGVFSGNMYALSSAALEGAGRAVSLTIELCGGMALWGGIMRVLERVGAVKRFSLLFRPLLKLLFPDAYRKNNGLEEISSTFAANMLGIGNAATPLALRAMKKLEENRISNRIDDGCASDDMVTFSVMNTAPISLLPTTLLTMRAASGSADPFAVIPAVWICSAASCTVAALLCRISNRVFGRKRMIEKARKRKILFIIYNRRKRELQTGVRD